MISLPQLELFTLDCSQVDESYVVYRNHCDHDHDHDHEHDHESPKHTRSLRVHDFNHVIHKSEFSNPLYELMCSVSVLMDFVTGILTTALSNKNKFEFFKL